MRFILLVLISFFCFKSFAKVNNLDSLIYAAKKLPLDSSKVLAYLNISNKFRIEHINHNKAIHFAKEALDLSKRISYDVGIFKSKIAIGYATRDKGLHTEGIELLREAIFFFESSSVLMKNQSILVSRIYAYTALADLLTYLPDYKLAQEYAFKAIEIAEKNNQIGIGQCWMTISIIFFKEKNIYQANIYADKALDFFIKNNATDDIARTYAYLARYSYSEGNIDKAIKTYQKSYDTYAKAKSLFGMRIVSYNLAEIYLGQKNIEKAKYYINETIRLNNAANDDTYLFYINNLNYKIQLENKEYKNAFTTAEQMLFLSRQQKNLSNVILSNQYLSKIYLLLKDSANAFLIEQRINSLKDSVYNSELAKNTEELSKKYETKAKADSIRFLNEQYNLNKEKLAQEKKLIKALQFEDKLQLQKLEQEILLNESLERENNLKKEQLRRAEKLALALTQEQKLLQQKQKDDKLIRLLLFALTFAALLLGAIYFFFYCKQKNTNKIIEKQKETLQVLLIDMHHRTKNNLQLLVSIMRMQRRNIQNEELLEMLGQSENRLQSIALIHEKLYKSNQAGFISLKEYLDQLAKVVLQEFNPNLSVAYQVVDKTKEKIFEIDVIIILGLIVNELLTNSLKYAFENITNPIILITLTSNPESKVYFLDIEDNGIGLSEEALKNKKNSIGLQLVQLLAAQLQGSIQFQKDKPGTSIRVSFRT